MVQLVFELPRPPEGTPSVFSAMSDGPPHRATCDSEFCIPCAVDSAGECSVWRVANPGSSSVLATGRPALDDQFTHPSRAPLDDHSWHADEALLLCWLLAAQLSTINSPTPVELRWTTITVGMLMSAAVCTP